MGGPSATEDDTMRLRATGSDDLKLTAGQMRPRERPCPLWTERRLPFTRGAGPRPGIAAYPLRGAGPRPVLLGRAVGSGN